MIEKEYQSIECKKLLQDVNVKVDKDNIEDKKTLDEIVKQVRNLNQQILAVYTPLVEEICLGKNVSKKDLENLLDWLVSSCISDDVVELFKKVCRHFYYQYTEVITDYVLIYKELYEDDIE